MGNYFTGVWSALFAATEVRILMVGLDNAGKTTLLYKLHLGEVQHTIPTIGQRYSHLFIGVEFLTIVFHRIQCWNGAIQKSKLECMGRGRTGKDQTIVAGERFTFLSYDSHHYLLLLLQFTFSIQIIIGFYIFGVMWFHSSIIKARMQ